MEELKYVTLIIGLALLISSCDMLQGSGNTTDSNSKNNQQTTDEQQDADEVSIVFDLKLNGMNVRTLEDYQSSSAASLNVQSLESSQLVTVASLSYFSGQLVIANQNDALDVSTYAVTASIDSNTMEVRLLQTIVLKVGSYLFTLNISKGSQQYAGIASTVISSKDVNTINMRLQPVIGDSLISTEIVEELGNLSFIYADIPGLKDTTDDIIELGVSINSSTEESLFRFDENGESAAYLNLTGEPDKIELKLYQNGAQIGKSIPEQETQAFHFGQNITMDLVPLYGRSQITLSNDGGNATFDIEFPSEVVETGSITADNLEISLTFNGTFNASQTATLSGSAFTPDESTATYKGGRVSFTGVNYDNLHVYLTYKTKDTNKLIGACNFQINLNSILQHDALCHISVQNSVVQSGNLMAYANIGVYSPSITPGVSIYVIHNGGEEKVLGVTDINGYIASYLRPGSYKIRAKLPANGRFGEISTVLDPMEVANISIELNASAPTNASVLVNGGDTASYSRYVTLDLAAYDDDKIVAFYASESDVVPEPGDSGWMTVTDPTPVYKGSFPFILSEGDGSKTVYVWFKNPSGYLSQASQDTIILQKDTGIYLANFSVTANSYADSSDLEAACQAEYGSTYTVADWNHLIAYTGTSQTKALEISNLLQLPSDGEEYAGVSNKRFVSFNGNRYFDAGNTRHYYISRLNLEASLPGSFPPFQDTRINSLYSPVSETPIDDEQDLVLIPETDKTVQVAFFNKITITEIQNLTARVACFGKTGYHPLLNGSFDDSADNFKYWGYVSGSVKALNNTLVLENASESSSTANQENIGVIDGERYALTADLKTATVDTTVTVQVLDAEGDMLAEVLSSANDWSTESTSFTVDVESGDLLPLQVHVSIPAGSSGNGFADNISLIRQ